MKIEWLYEAQVGYQELLSYYKNTVGTDGARAFSNRILETVQRLETFPEMGLIREELLTGKLGFRSLFIGKYICIYRIDADTIFIYHLADARTNYIYRIFGMEP
jgi:plasmid stabilization system protein ParE